MQINDIINTVLRIPTRHRAALFQDGLTILVQETTYISFPKWSGQMRIDKTADSPLLTMDPLSSVLLTELYQLTMLQDYVEKGMEEEAVFELFVRKLPDTRNFLVVVGLDQTLDFLKNLHFTSEELGWVERSGQFGPSFVDYLSKLRFSGDVHAMQEGTIFFPNEPIIRVTAHNSWSPAF